MNATRKLTGWHFLAMIAGFFAVVVAVNVTLAWFAVHSWSGLVVKNGYVASQQFNRRLADAQRQKARGWSSQLTYAAGNIEVRVSDRSGEAVTDLALKAKLERPVSDIFDTVVTLSETIPGRYRASHRLAAGAWDVEVNGTWRDGSAYHSVFRILVKGDAGP